MNKSKREIRCIIDGLPSDLINGVMMQEHCVALKGDDGEILRVSLSFDSYRVCSLKKNGYSSYFTLAYIRPTAGIPQDGGRFMPLYWGSPTTIYDRFFGANDFTSEEVVDVLNFNEVSTDFPQNAQYKMRFELV